MNPPKKGKMMYVRPELDSELRNLMSEKQVKRSVAQLHLINYYAVGKEVENLAKFRIGAPPVRQYKIDKK